MTHADGPRTEPERFFDRGHHLVEEITVDRPPAELYTVWRRVENLPRFIGQLEEVREIEPGKTHWLMRGPLGATLHWDADIIRDVSGELIAWASLQGASVENAGSVRFLPAPDGRGTVVRVTIEYIPPAGSLGKAIAGALGENPEQLVRSHLRRFKQMMESGQIGPVAGRGETRSAPDPLNHPDAAGPRRDRTAAEMPHPRQGLAREHDRPR